MGEFDHGLVLGKFYPPHAGHHLVCSAAARCRRLTVLVCASAVESIPLADRVAWMREVHPEAGIEVVGAVDDIPVDVTDPAVWDAHMAIFRAAVPDPVDAVFTSEPYGEELGRRFGATPVTVDIARATHPVSGTAVRRDPVGCWRFWPPRCGRIAERQFADENAAARAGSPVLFCDTDPLATTIWHERYMGTRNPQVESIAARARHDLWLLTDDTGVPFEDDGLRDGEHVRTWMTDRFREELTRRALPHVLLTGPHEERLRTAVTAVDTLLTTGWHFAAPLPERGGLAPH
ncbi:AAA family ATPase [Streptomyces sp. NPDC008238]